jgi:hypothetical protein
MHSCLLILASLGFLLASGQQHQWPSSDDSCRAPLATAVLAAADALGKPAVGNYALKKGTTDTLGSSNARFRRVVARIVGGNLPWSRADAEARASPSDGPQFLQPPGPRLSVVGIGGSITSGRMLPDYCKECEPRERYRHVWSGYFKRALEQAIYDAAHRYSSDRGSSGSSNSINSTTADAHVADKGRPSRRGTGGVAGVLKQQRPAQGHAQGHLPGGFGSFLGGKTMPRAPGSSAASLAVGHAGHPSAAASSADAAKPNRVASGDRGPNVAAAVDAAAAGAAHAAAAASAVGKWGDGWGDDGWAGQAVRVATHGVNGASVCAFARHARSHVGQWLAENRANGTFPHLALMRWPLSYCFFSRGLFITRYVTLWCSVFVILWLWMTGCVWLGACVCGGPACGCQCWWWRRR